MGEVAPEEDYVVFEGLFQPTHLLLILLIALIVFGPRRLPELGRSLGTAIRDFKQSLTAGGSAARDSARRREPGHAHERFVRSEGELPAPLVPRTRSNGERAILVPRPLSFRPGGEKSADRTQLSSRWVRRATLRPS